MKLNAVLVFLALVTSGFAATPGSIAPITFKLVVTKDTGDSSKVLKNGNTEYTFAQTSYSITNTVILAEATRLGLLTAGNYKGWQVVAAFDRDAVFYEVFAYNKTLNQSVSLAAIMTISHEQGGRSAGGKVVRTPQNAIVSGSFKVKENIVATLKLNGVTYTGTAAYSATETLTPTVAVGGFQWVYKASGGTFIGFGDDETPLTGSIGLGSPVKVADMDTLF